MKIAAESIISALKLLMLIYFDETICINRRFSCVCGPALRTCGKSASAWTASNGGDSLWIAVFLCTVQC